MADILIADDDPEILRLLEKAFTIRGHKVVVARDGEEAVDHAKSKRFDVIITDIIMPKKAGIETILELKILYPDIKIIAISGGGRKGNMDFLRMAELIGATDVLAKPFEPKELLDKVENCLAS
ncbi:MAG: response regulator [Sphingomonadales bacterium]